MGGGGVVLYKVERESAVLDVHGVTQNVFNVLSTPPTKILGGSAGVQSCEHEARLGLQNTS